MNVSLLAMSNSLAESFIIVNSIFFGVSDIGISTVVQQAAFYGLINQGTEFFFNSITVDVFRNVLSNRSGGNADRLVDRLQRNCVLFALLGSDVWAALRKQSRAFWCPDSDLSLHFAHFPDEVFIEV
jgi:hypothetical protein